MFYAITIIRLNLLTKIFENTEVNNFMLKGDIERELEQLKVTDEQFQNYIDIQKGQSITIQVESTEKLWFAYIHRIS